MKNITKKELLDILRDWQYNLQLAEELRAKAKEHCYSITPCYGATGGAPTGMASSKIERYYIVQARIEEDLRTAEDKIVSVCAAISRARLTNRERMLIDSIMNGRSLSSYAREKNIYISNVYKIRDKAIGKILASFGK